MLFSIIVISALSHLFVVGLRVTTDDRHNHPEFKNEPITASANKENDEYLNAEYWQNMADSLVKQKSEGELNENVAKNIIIFLGDGLGLHTTTAARSYADDESKPLTYEKFPYTGMSKTYCVDRQVADSACTVTAYLSGVKTNFETIGVSAAVTVEDCEDGLNEEYHTTSIAKWAMDDGKVAGVVTTTSLTDASPTGNYAHIAFRDWESDADVEKSGCDTSKVDDIARQLIRGEVGEKLRVIMGGGRQYFIPKDEEDEEGHKGKRLDGVNLIKEWQEKKKDLKSEYVWNRQQLLDINPNETDYLLGMFEDEHCVYNLKRIEKGEEHLEPTLSDMVDKAIDILSRHDKGFYLFVEGGRIDHAHHSNTAKLSLDETKEFSKAIELALKKVNIDETLIVVTADHSHSFAYAGYPNHGQDILGTMNKLAEDKMDYMILGYANGKGYDEHVEKDKRGRKDPTKMKRPIDFRYPAMVPKSSESHGGEDVAVYAIGPWAHLFTGNYEQHTIPHMMAYAACIGNGLKACK